MISEATEKVVIVNEHDEWLGTADKLDAHREGILHRAFSVFIVNDNNELLLQQRAISKYHSGGLWTNACCSHPRPKESTLSAAHRRLIEEMGFDCELEKIFHLRYKADLDNNMIENEYDHVYIGKYTGDIKPNKSEVEGYKYVNIEQLAELVEEHPEQYTEWFKLLLPKFLAHINATTQAA